MIQHYNPGYKKSIASNSDIDFPEPESCPQPHGSQSVNNYLSVPGTSQIDSSFRSLSSRGDTSKYHDRRPGDTSKRSVDYTKRSNSPYSSPRTTAQDMERIVVVEQQIKTEKEKYRKLEKKYKDLMASQTQNQMKLENMVQELQKKLEDKNGDKITPMSIAKDVQDLKEHLGVVEKRLDFVLEFLDNKDFGDAKDVRDLEDNGDT
ncbi:hypothetical protein SteCoe_37491 [Stentor coeruleus]|uniref:Uncharacterized protein n=1 Tax=Stentor coeruleus TaxID=5963 RepID=A0A1R2AN55_9CILI|nr:hypothetical protein SteCoe_37491 [Stentor coeruleus]